MTPRELVWAALNHQEPERVPIDLNGTLCTALTRRAYDGLRAFLGLAPDPDPNISSREMDTVRAWEDLLTHYRVDTRCVHQSAPLIAAGRDLPDGSYYDGFGVRWQPAAYYHDAVERPLAEATLEDLAKLQWPDPYDAGRRVGLRARAQELSDHTPYCLVADIPALGPFEGACVLRGYEQFCMDLHTEPRFAEALLDKVTEYAIATWDAILTEVGDLVHVAAQGDDVGSQTGPFISPAMYRQYVKPRQARLFSFIHAKSQAKVWYHSCGSVYDLIPDFIEIGVDVLNPVQRSAAKMDLARLKREFGKDLCFWGGGIDVQQQLPYLSPDEVADEVTRALDIMAPGGGYVFFPTHNIQADITPDRIDRLFRAAAEYRG